MYWFTDHVFFDGKWFVLLALAVAPQRDNVPLKLIAPAVGLLLMVGSLLQLQDPIFLVFVGLCAGVILKSIPLSEPGVMVLAVGGMLMGMPINGFTGLLAARANFQPQLMQSLFGATAGIGCLTIACSFTGLFLLAQQFYRRYYAKNFVTNR